MLFPRGGAATSFDSSQKTVTPNDKQVKAALARTGLRRDQCQARTVTGTGRARIGRPSSQRSKSSANFPADW